jgi:hypothetical protein
MNRLASALLLTFLVPALALAAPQKRGPSTAAERHRALDVTRRLERDPFGKKAEADRRWLFQWILDIPDVQVTSCSGPLEALISDVEDGRHGRDLYVQSVFGMAAFLIEKPGKSDDWIAVQRAGIESVLRAYEAMRHADDEVRWPELDKLESARRAGKLEQVVRDRVSCHSDDEAIPPGTI